MKKLIKICLVFFLCCTIFSIHCDESSDDSVDIDAALVGDWMEYGSASFTSGTFAGDGIRLEPDGDVYDLDGIMDAGVWSNYWVDEYEAKFTTLNNGIIVGVNYESSSALSFSGNYTLGTSDGSVTIILNINENGTIVPYYYLKAD